MLAGLGEAKSGIEGDALLGDPRRAGAFERFDQLALHLIEEIRVGRLRLHLFRRAAHVHETDRRALDGFAHLRIAGEAGDVVDDLGSGVEGGPGDIALAGVDAERNLHAAGELSHHRLDPLALLAGADRLCARPARLPADVEDVRALLREDERVLDRFFQREEA